MSQPVTFQLATSQPAFSQRVSAFESNYVVFAPYVDNIITEDDDIFDAFEILKRIERDNPNQTYVSQDEVEAFINKRNNFTDRLLSISSIATNAKYLIERTKEKMSNSTINDSFSKLVDFVSEKNFNMEVFKQLIFDINNTNNNDQSITLPQEISDAQIAYKKLNEWYTNKTRRFSEMTQNVNQQLKLIHRYVNTVKSIENNLIDVDQPDEVTLLITKLLHRKFELLKISDIQEQIKEWIKCHKEMLYLTALIPSEEPHICGICKSDKVDTVCVPCGHTFCQSCSVLLTSCSYCSRTIEQKIRFYLS